MQDNCGIFRSFGLEELFDVGCYQLSEMKWIYLMPQDLLCVDCWDCCQSGYYPEIMWVQSSQRHLNESQKN